MERDSSFNKQLRKETIARAVLNKIIKMSEVDINEINKKIHDVDKKIKIFQKAIRRKKQKERNYGEVFRQLESKRILKPNLETK